jgi:hypothetical protein
MAPLPALLSVGRKLKERPTSDVPELVNANLEHYKPRV